MNASTYEVREHPVIGTHYVRFELWVEDTMVYAQLSPYSDAEARQRIAQYRSPPTLALVKKNYGASLRAKSGPKPNGEQAKYEWRTPVEDL